MVRMGFPIRKSAGQRLLTPHRSLSPRATSFIACYAKASTNCPYLTLENARHHRQACLHDGADLSVIWFEHPNNEDALIRHGSAAARISQLDNHYVVIDRSS